MSRFLRCLLDLVLVCVFAALPVPAQTASADLASPLFMTSGGFCPNGVILKIRWQFAEELEGLSAWGSYCHDTAATGRIESAEFLAPATLSLFLAGYPGKPGLRLALQNVESGEEIEVHPISPPGPQWRRDNLDLPPGWVGKAVRMIAEAHATGPDDWLGFTAPLLPYSSLAIGTIPTDRPQSGFCRNGVFDEPPWPPGAPRSGLAVWGSYCRSGAEGTGWMASATFPAGGFLSTYLAGYPNSAHIRLAAENLQTGRQLPLQLADAPGASWRLFHFPLPAEWRGQPVRLLVEDHATGADGWVAFTEPGLAPATKNEALFAGRILGLTLLLFLLLMLPPAAIVVAAFLRGIEDPPDLTALALLGMGIVGYAAFWIYFFSRTGGIAYSYVVLLLSCALLVYASTVAKHRTRLRALRRMLAAAAFFGIASIVVISLGFVYGQPPSVSDYAAHRFGPPDLWIDNFLPKLFADGVFNGHIPRPLASGWLSSDRPPLQTGMVLWLYPYTHGTRELLYQSAATILQLTFLAGLWAYLKASRVGRKATALALLVTFASGFVLLNSFYTWPKLLPVGFLLLFPAYLLTDRFHLVRNDWRVGAAAGLAAAFAMLCHGGSIFALLGIWLALVFLRRIPTLRFLLPAALLAGLLYLPWTLYQKHYDPPGDRLLKMHLAGVDQPSPEVKFGRLLVAHYSNLQVKGVLEYKLRNFARLGEDIPAFWKHAAQLLQSLVTGNGTQQAANVAFLRDSMFLHWFSSIDVLGLSPLALLLCALLRRRRSPEFQQACTLWLCTALTLAVWCVLMFGPGTTVAHQGCYFTEIAAFVGGTLAFWALSPKLAAIISAIHLLFNVTLYVWLAPPRPAGFATFMGPLNPLLSFTCIAAAFGMAFILWRMAFSAPTPQTKSS